MTKLPANTAADFWSHIDSSRGPTACWPWLPTKENPQGRARFRFEGKMRDVHVISFYLVKGEWPRKFDVAPCPRLSSCCNPSHIEKRRAVQHKTLTRDFSRVSEQLNRQSAFSRYLARAHPDLHWLVQLLGDNAGQFLKKHEGLVIRLQMTIPTRAQLIEEARAIDCFSAIDQAEPCDLMKARKQLQAQYECDQAGIETFARMGQALLKRSENQNE